MSWRIRIRTRLSALQLLLIPGLLASAGGIAGGAASAHEGHDDDSGRHAANERADVSLESVDGAWWRGSDFVIEGVGSASGYTLYVRRENERYSPRPLATIQPGGDGADTWLGYLCVTGDATTAIVNLAQRWTTNKPGLRDRGGLLYAVDIASGEVRALASGVAFKYHAVGCGAGDEVSYVSHLGVDQEQSLVLLGTKAGRFTEVAKVDGQLTAPVPSAGSVVALRGNGLVRLSHGRERVVARFDGEPYQVRPNVAGGVDLLVRTGTDVDVVRVKGSRTTTIATGPLHGTGLEMGNGGHTFAPGATLAGTPSAEGFTALPEAVGGTSGGELSVKGKVSLTPTAQLAPSSSNPADEPSADRSLAWAGTGATLLTAPAIDPAAEVFTTLAGGSRTSRSTGPRAELAAANTPACGVPRNNPARQAYSSTNVQSEWAVQMAVRNLLKGSFSRSADYLRSGLPAYSPSEDFPVPTLAGPGGVIPPAVMNGILAQESAYRHASRRTLPGNGGNPLISDFYGAEGTVDRIDYGLSDCGYGISQVTSGMRADETSISANGKAKIAIDYAENIQAGANILAKKWNQLYAAGIRFGNSDPKYVDNWYTALWAYNSGVQPTAAYGNTTGCTPSPSCTDSHGHWGLGWTNNPANPDYPPDRDVFLRSTYADAEHPSDWPYQERVLGFAETPIFNYEGEPAYMPGDNLITYPDRFAFCDPSNECDPTNEHPEDPSLNYCKRVDNHCWWHTSNSGVDCGQRDCSESGFRYSTTAAEPAGDNPWSPDCTSALGGAAIIVDELPDPNKNLFCPSRNWSNKGSFTYTVGTKPAPDGTPLPIGEIDFHQIAAGFGAHTWFAGNYSGTDIAHRVTGTWKPNLPTTAGPYVIKVHIPQRGASTGSAKYTITRADGTTTTKVINQHEHWDHWKSLGVYRLGPNAKVQLTNVTGEVAEQTATVAFDAMAFIPAPGTIKKATVESFAYFDENTNIDSDPFSRTVFAWSSLETRESVYDWARNLTGTVLSYPDCGAGSVPVQCIKPNTRAAFQRWSTQVSSAGSTNAVTKWLNFANAATYRPTTNKVKTAWRSNDASYKIRNKVVLSFVVKNGAIVKGTDDVELDDRTADTHLPPFIRDIMRAIQTDYGVTLPDLSYSKEDLNEYDHQVREADPIVDGVLPGQAEHQAATYGMLSNGCLGAVQVSGGTIGYRPMLATGYVDGAFEGWKNKVEEREGSWYPSDTLGQFAHDIYETFFDQGDPPMQATPSPFNGAPPIWQELNVAFCSNGTVKPAYGSQILRQSWMPNGYLYRNGSAITQSGTSRTSAAPLFTGNFQKFSTADEQGRDNPYEDCDSDTGRNGNPWGMDLFKAPLIPAFDTEDHPDEAHLCWDKDFVTSDDLP